MRLKVIDYDVMKVAFDEKFKQTYQLIQNGETHLDNLAEGFHEADGVIFALPTIEAEPVKHGRWLDTMCSNCQKVALLEELDGDIGRITVYAYSNYCPNCGAKMDGGADHED